MKSIKNIIAVLLMACAGMVMASAQQPINLSDGVALQIDDPEQDDDMAAWDNDNGDRLSALPEKQSLVVKQALSSEELRVQTLMKEARKCKTRSIIYGVCGGVSLGIGALFTAGGIGLLCSDNSLAGGFGIVSLGVGGIFTLGSVPLFIASHHQRVKAATFSASVSALAVPGAAPTPGLGFTLCF